MNKITLTSYSLAVITSLIFLGCNPVSLNEDEYVDWVTNSNNLLVQHRSVGGVSFQLQFKPSEFIQQQMKVNQISSEAVRGAGHTNTYFDLVIFPTNPGVGNILKAKSSSQSEYQRSIYYYSYRFREQIHLISDGDTIPCELYHFVRDHGLSPKLRFALGFPLQSSAKEMTLVLNDEVFGSGIIKFNFDHAVLNNIPEIKNKISQL